MKNIFPEYFRKVTKVVPIKVNESSFPCDVGLDSVRKLNGPLLWLQNKFTPFNSHLITLLEALPLTWKVDFNHYLVPRLGRIHKLFLYVNNVSVNVFSEIRQILCLYYWMTMYTYITVKSDDNFLHCMPLASICVYMYIKLSKY